jgi:hypothetical protein
MTNTVQMHSIIVLSLLLTGTMAAATQRPSVLSVKLLQVQPLDTPFVTGHFKLTPSTCSSKTSHGSRGASESGNRGGSSSGRDTSGTGGRSGNTATMGIPSTPKMLSSTAAPAAAAAACTGFSLSNTADFSTNTNTASFRPSTNPIVLVPGATVQSVIGTVMLQSNGFMLPMDAGMPQISVQGLAHIKSQDGHNLGVLPFEFVVSSSLGNPSPANKAGLFVLTTPSNTFSFKAAAAGSKPSQGSNQTPLQMVNLKVIGFLPAAGSAAGAVTVLGDWGQPAPAARSPGPRVYIKPGPPQQVQLIAKISTA